MKISKEKRRHLLALCDRIAVNNGSIDRASVVVLLNMFAANMRANVPHWWMS